MALFKIFGNFSDLTSSASNPPSITSISTHQPGYCYFDINTNKFYIDTSSTVEGLRQLNGTYYGECSTNAGTAEKVVTIPGFALTHGVSVLIRFNNTNTASVNNLAFNISNTGSRPIQLSITEKLQSPDTLECDKLYQFVYVRTGNNNQGVWVLLGTGTSKDGLVFKGTIGNIVDNATVLALPDVHYAGWSYRVVTAGTYAGQKCEVGDIIACIYSSTTSSNDDWTVIQNNIDGAVIGPSSVTNGAIAIFNGTSGKLIKGGSIANHTFTPSGTVTPTVTLKTSTKSVLNQVTSAGTKPTHGTDTFTSGTYPSISMSVSNEILTFAWSSGTLPTYSQGTFNGGAMPTFSTANVLSSVTVSSATATFSGASVTLQHSIS